MARFEGKRSRGELRRGGRRKAETEKEEEEEEGACGGYFG
jgi:hypothetical protein